MTAITRRGLLGGALGAGVATAVKRGPERPVPEPRDVTVDRYRSWPKYNQERFAEWLERCGFELNACREVEFLEPGWMRVHVWERHPRTTLSARVVQYRTQPPEFV